MSSGVLGCEMSFAKKNLLKVGYNAFLHSFFLSCSTIGSVFMVAPCYLILGLKSSTFCCASAIK